ncbi:MAG: glycosyltransferase [Castellaniella sp.]|uniref:glycosyltransferase n=1 Tax=Castellaniella sp. TaxID=1955812 RepID=UPI003C76F763
MADVFSGVALAFVLQTSWRLPVGVGLGEMILSATMLMGFMVTALIWKFGGRCDFQGMRHWGPLLVAGYLLVVLLPQTWHSSSINLAGSSVRDWLAYAFSLLFLCSIAFRPTHYRRMTASLIAGLLLFWVLGLMFGSSDDVWYLATRFRGGALNPNQVALYVLCSLLLLLIYLRHMPLIFAALLGLAVFGYLAQSNAAKVSMVVFVLAGCFAVFIPYLKLRARLLWFLLAVGLGWLFFRHQFLTQIEARWAAVDYGNARQLLFVHGIDAWLSSIPGFLWGFGAGSYSGMAAPFQGSEAHNTVIDALTIGGFPMLFAVYLFPVSAWWLAYRQGRVLIFSALSSLIVFSFFHYVARHPIYWLAGYGALVYLVVAGRLAKQRPADALPADDRSRLKILFISYFFPPYSAIGAVRTGKMVRRLLDAGHDVRVISATRQGLPQTLQIGIPDGVVNYTDWIDVDMFVTRALGKKTVTKAKSVGATPTSKAGRLSRFVGMAGRFYVSWTHVPDRYIGWYFFARKACQQTIDQGWRPDVIYASATPYTALMVASSIGRRYQIPWVGELRDLWTDNPYAHHRALSRWLERRTLRTAAALVTVSEPLAKVLSDKYQSPCHVIMNGFDAEDFAKSAPRAAASALEHRRLRVVYTGQLYAGRRDPTVLFQALALDRTLMSQVDVDFYGPNLAWVADRAAEYGVQDAVHVHEPVARVDAIRAQQQADVLLLLTWDDPREQGVLTGKLFEYIGAGRPILVVGHVNGDAASLVRREGFGVASNDPAEISTFMKALLSDMATRSAYDQAFHERAGRYERGVQVDRLVGVFDAVRAPQLNAMQRG